MHVCIQCLNIFFSFSDMKQAFDLFDKNHDGRISSDELGRVLRTLGHNYSQEEVADMIKTADTNGNYWLPIQPIRAIITKLSRLGSLSTALTNELKN